MELVNIDICLKLYRYRMYIKLISEKIFTTSDDFIINKINDFFTENIFDKELTYENVNILMLENDALLKLFKEYIETISETFMYTYNTDYIEHQLPYVLSNLSRCDVKSAGLMFLMYARASQTTRLPSSTDFS